MCDIRRASKWKISRVLNGHGGDECTDEEQTKKIVDGGRFVQHDDCEQTAMAPAQPGV